MAHPPPHSFLTQADMAERLAAFPPLTVADRVRVQINDVGFLRHLWKNFGEVAPGVYRSNHPGAQRLRRYSDMGIKAVFNLRGSLKHAPQRLEAEACAALGMEFHLISLSARKAPTKVALQELFHKFDTLPRPFLMHCKSGADRAGLASALYLLDQSDADMPTARRELSLRYLHIRQSETGILDHVLDLYEARQSASPLSIRDWVATEYDRDAVAQSYAALS